MMRRNMFIQLIFALIAYGFSNRIGPSERQDLLVQDEGKGDRLWHSMLDIDCDFVPSDGSEGFFENDEGKKLTILGGSPIKSQVAYRRDNSHVPDSEILFHPAETAKPEPAMFVGTEHRPQVSSRDFVVALERPLTHKMIPNTDGSPGSVFEPIKHTKARLTRYSSSYLPRANPDGTQPQTAYRPSNFINTDSSFIFDLNDLIPRSIKPKNEEIAEWNMTSASDLIDNTKLDHSFRSISEGERPESATSKNDDEPYRGKEETNSSDASTKIYSGVNQDSAFDREIRNAYDTLNRISQIYHENNGPDVAESMTVNKPGSRHFFHKSLPESRKNAIYAMLRSYLNGYQRWKRQLKHTNFDKRIHRGNKGTNRVQIITEIPLNGRDDIVRFEGDESEMGFLSSLRGIARYPNFRSPARKSSLGPQRKFGQNVLRHFQHPRRQPRGKRRRKRKSVLGEDYYFDISSVGRKLSELNGFVHGIIPDRPQNLSANNDVKYSFDYKCVL